MQKAHPNSERRQRGYTLTELIVVLALIAIAAALVVPSIGHAYSSVQLRIAASGVSEAFKQARIHSVYEGKVIRVLFGPADQTRRSVYVVSDDGRTLSRIPLQSDVKIRVGRSNVWLDELPPVHFFPNGTSEGVQIDLEGPRQRHVQVALDPLTAHARLTQIYEGENAESAGVTVINGGTR